MSASTALALTCLGIAALDVVVGFGVVLPRIRSVAQRGVRIGLIGNAVVLVILAGLFQAGVFEVPTPPAAEIPLTPAPPGP